MPIHKLSPKTFLFVFKLPMTIYFVVRHRLYKIDSKIICAWLNYYNFTIYFQTIQSFLCNLYTAFCIKYF